MLKTVFIEGTPHRKCPDCKEIKSFSDFNKGATYCRLCAAIRGKIRRSIPDVKDHYHTVNKTWRIANKAKIKAQRSGVVPTIRNKVSSIKSRSKRLGIICAISNEYVLSLWYEQEGMCLLSGLPMVLRPDTKTYVWNSMSIDRIEFSDGYVPGNVRLVLACINAFRGRMGDKQMLNVVRSMYQRILL